MVRRDQLPHDSLEEHPGAALACLLPARQPGVSQLGTQKARCPEQAIVAVLIRLAVFLSPAIPTTRRGRAADGMHTRHSTAQHSAEQTTVALQHTIVYRQVRGVWDQTSRHIEPLRSWPVPISPISEVPGACASTQSRPRALAHKRPHETSSRWEARRAESCSGEWLACPLITQQLPHPLPRQRQHAAAGLQQQQHW